MKDLLKAQRKYVAFWGVLLLSTILTTFDKLTGAEWVNIVMPVFGLYMAGNVSEHHIKTKGNNANIDSG